MLVCISAFHPGSLRQKQQTEVGRLVYFGFGLRTPDFKRIVIGCCAIEGAAGGYEIGGNAVV